MGGKGANKPGAMGPQMMMDLAREQAELGKEYLREQTIANRPQQARE